MAHNDVYQKCKQLDEVIVSRKDDKRWSLEFPIEILRLCGGLGVDSGSSASKFVYIESCDADLVANAPSGTKCKLHMKSFPNHEISEGSDSIKRQLHIIRHDSSQKIDLMSSGVGGHTFHAKLNEVFNVNMVNVSEFDSAPSGFFFLAKYHSPRALLYPFIEGAIEVPIQKVLEYGQVCHQAYLSKLTNSPIVGIEKAGKIPKWPTQFVDKNIDDSKTLTDSDLFPCILVTLGSGNAYYHIDEDGKYRMADMSPRGGRFFMSLASYMLGTDDFNEVINLAEQGDNANVDIFSEDIVDESADDYYSLGSRIELLCMSMGKVIFKNNDEIKREDLARSLVLAVIMDMVHHVQMLAVQLKVKHVFFSGSFMNRFLVRYLTTVEMARRNANFTLMNNLESDLRYYFMKHGPYLTAFGCLAAKIQLTKKALEESNSRKTE
ncbi:hypothetical protein CAPTEDRAFT_189283 [Capitella teleta]|uniref:Uncharacterized protein n=1 Tax=Capitella teleta TaxID=283909 RepID=R7UKC8_CAPTE|nr:hypothetical protein CAPTEDRAFT_189283 [Capitella teleta]|eukprot:ELU06650.1 hypothetical protein CAPTEDRAFT_189283 [Capitella teleta]